MSDAHNVFYNQLQARGTPANLIRDPGDGKQIDIQVDDGVCLLTIAVSATETRTLPPVANFGAGTRVTLIADTVGSGGTCTVSGISFAAAGDRVVYVITTASGTKTWTAAGGGLSSVARTVQIPLTDFRKPADLAVVLAASAGSSILGITTGTYGSAAPYIMGNDAKGTTKTDKALVQVPVPADYVAAGAMTIVANVAMEVAASVSASIDFEVVRVAAPTTDICATSATSMNSITAANKTFTLTTTNVVPGDVLSIRMTAAATDGAATDNAIAHINTVRLTYLSYL